MRQPSKSTDVAYDVEVSDSFNAFVCMKIKANNFRTQ